MQTQYDIIPSSFIGSSKIPLWTFSTITDHQIKFVSNVEDEEASKETTSFVYPKQSCNENQRYGLKIE